jgi:phage shock protein B
VHGIWVVTIVFSGIVLALSVVGGTFLMALKILKEGVSGKSKGLKNEEVMMIQELHKGFSKMENRVEVLETILLEMEHEKKYRDL